MVDVVDLCNARRTLVFVDELDRGWDSSEDAKAFVAGLFQACVSVNQLTPRLTVYVSLRQELYDNIPALYEDAQKYRDIIETITWDERSLLSVAASRIRHSIPELEDEDDLPCWSLVFAETLDYRSAKSFNYMVDRTLYRPREIVQFCTDCVEMARQTASASPIDYAVISAAELGYSESRAKDIAAEYRFQFPGLLSVFEVFRGREYTMEREELQLLCLEITCGEHNLDQATVWARGQDPDYMVEVLWRVGFLRAYAVGGLKAKRRSGSSYVGRHQVASPNLGAMQRFQVHQMFRSYLGMKEPRKKR